LLLFGLAPAQELQPIGPIGLLRASRGESPSVGLVDLTLDLLGALPQDHLG
jgi:hypothetical protein